MKLYKNTKVKVRLSDEETDFFDIVSDVLQEDTLALYLFIICLDYVLRTSIDLMKENGFTLEKTRSRQYPAQTIADADYTDDIALLGWTAPTPRLNYSCIVWRKQQTAQASVSLQTKRNTYALIKIKMETSAH